METGKLYLVATPIGNLEDMTYRAVRVLSEVDIIAAEDTRNSIKLLNHFDIKVPMTSYHEFNKYDKADTLVRDMLNGKNVAAITDAGTPGISDPGEVLAKKCIEAGIAVVPVPGACAAVNALIASGLDTRRFSFEAFLPMDKKQRRMILDSLRNETRTIVIYEAPHRLTRTLEELFDVLGDRRVSVCRELTKKHEVFYRASLSEACSFYNENEPKGEIVLVIEGKTFDELKQEEEKQWEQMSIEEHLEKYMSGGIDKKEAIKLVAKDRGVPKRDIYYHVNILRD